MKDNVLFHAICILGLSYIQNFFISLAYIVFITYHYRHVNKIYLLTILLLSMQVRIFYPVSHDVPTEEYLQVKEIKANYVIASTGNESVLVYNASGVGFDDVIKVKGEYQEIDSTNNITEFNFRTWANRRHIYYSINAKEIEIIERGNSLRAQLYHHIQTLDEITKTWLLSTLFSIHDNETYYMISSSGMHVSYLAYMLESILKVCMNSMFSSMISILFILFIGLSTTMSMTIIRVLLFRVIKILCTSLSYKDQLGLAMIILIFLFPHSIYEMSFVIPIAFRFTSIFNIKKIHKRLMNFLILIPIQFYFFQSIDLLSLLLFPILRCVFGVNFLLSLLIILFPIINFIIPFLMTVERFIYGMFKRIDLLYYHPNILWIWLWMYYGFRYLSFKRHRDLSKLAILLLYSQYGMYLDPFLHVHMLDVGQGDATLIVLPFHQGTMLIDVAGNHYKDISQDIIYPILRKKGIRSLDKVVITHDDLDHSGGLEQLSNLITIKEVVTNKQEIITLNNHIFSILLNDREYEDKNKNSLILFFEVFDERLLFMGDASIDEEYEILKRYPNLKVDILKVGHHGSKSSSSLRFLHQINPMLALISCGRNNRYHHPNEDVLNNLKREDIYPLVTAQKGEVEIFLSKYFKFYRTADNEFGIID